MVLPDLQDTEATKFNRHPLSCPGNLLAPLEHHFSPLPWRGTGRRRPSREVTL